MCPEENDQDGEVFWWMILMIAKRKKKKTQKQSSKILKISGRIRIRFMLYGMVKMHRHFWNANFSPVSE